MNCFRILLASSIAVRKSPTLKPKLIVKLARSLSYVKGVRMTEKRHRERESRRIGQRNMSSVLSFPEVWGVIERFVFITNSAASSDDEHKSLNNPQYRG